MAAVGSREAPRRDLNRALEIATRRFVEAMTKDALAHRADVRQNVPAATLDERIATLPEPWRTRTRHELETLKDRIAKTLGHRKFARSYMWINQGSTNAQRAPADSEQRPEGMP